MNTKKIYHIVMITLYSIALFVCFLCNLLIDHRLTWALVVFVSVMMAFSITNLPFMVKKYKLIIPALTVSVLVFVLLYVCNLITAGDWLFRYAYPIALYPIVLVWLIIGVCVIKGWGLRQKSTVLSLLCGVALVTINVWVDTVLTNEFTIRDSLNLFLTQFSSQGSNYIMNLVIAVCLFLYFVMSVLTGTFKKNKQK